jgi:hypothetical protein
MHTCSLVVVAVAALSVFCSNAQPFQLHVQEDDQDIIESLNDVDDMEDLRRRFNFAKLQSYLVQKVGETGQAVLTPLWFWLVS